MRSCPDLSATFSLRTLAKPRCHHFIVLLLEARVYGLVN